MELSITYTWLLAGALLVAAEMFGISGIGLLFVGLGAITTGSLISLNVIDEGAIVLQFTSCFAATAVWALLLWKVVQRSKHGGKGGFSNIIGETAYVGSQGLRKGKPGEVTWSGTIMKAELDNAAVGDLEAGQPVTIISIAGTTLTVKPKA
jgi:membrane protein implicated in regulation of membrane protease activity